MPTAEIMKSTENDKEIEENNRKFTTHWEYLGCSLSVLSFYLHFFFIYLRSNSIYSLLYCFKNLTLHK